MWAWEGDLDDPVVALRKHLVDRTGLANRTRGIPPHLCIIEQLKEAVDEWQSPWVVPDQECPRGLAISSSQNVVNVVLRKASRSSPLRQQGCGILRITVHHLLSVC